MNKITRTIHFYYLNIDFKKEFEPEDGNKFREIFKIIIALAKTKDKLRYLDFGEKSIFIQDVKVEPEERIIIGKLRCVRKDLLPEIMNTNTDEARGIDAKEEEGLVETTHFIIDYSKENKKLAIEFNQFGAKINDFANYIENIGINKNALNKVEFTPIIKNELSKIQNRINKCSEFKVKVHKDNIDKIESLDENLYSALMSSIEHFNSEYATLILKFDYKIRTETNNINKSIFNIINKLIKHKEKTELFEQLSLKAEDKEKNNLIEVFDLLIDKVKSEIKVEKKERYRTIVSEDIFSKMKDEINRKKI